MVMILNQKNSNFLRFCDFNFKEIPKFLDFGINGVIVANVDSKKS